MHQYTMRSNQCTTTTWREAAPACDDLSDPATAHKGDRWDARVIYDGIDSIHTTIHQLQQKK
jgi:hypothetical protein